MVIFHKLVWGGSDVICATQTRITHTWTWNSYHYQTFWIPTKTLSDSIDAFHCRQLGYDIGKIYPRDISNAKLYKLELGVRQYEDEKDLGSSSATIFSQNTLYVKNATIYSHLTTKHYIGQLMCVRSETEGETYFPESDYIAKENTVGNCYVIMYNSQ